MATQPPVMAAVTRVTPFVHVFDVERSIEFYKLIGLEPTDRLTGSGGATVWASIGGGPGRMMLCRGSGPISAEAQAVIFYMYTNDVAALRQHLLDNGLHDASVGGGAATRAVFGLTHPHYMPAGELRVHDPDGYVLLIGQLG